MKRKKIRKTSIWLDIVVVILLLFLLVPVFIIIPLSFNAADYLCFPPKGLSMKWYQAFFGNRQWVGALLYSLRLGIATTIISMILGTMAAEGLRKLKWKGKGILQEYFMLPLYIPVIILAIAIFNFETNANLTSTFPGLVCGHCVLAIPYVVSTMSSGLMMVNPNIESAAQSLGASKLRTFFESTLPIVRPSLISSAIFAFVTSFDELIITMFISGVSGTTLPLMIWSSVRTEIDPTITAIASIVIVSLTVIMCTNTFARKKSDGE